MSEKTFGVLIKAEIIPIEPDVINVAVGKCVFVIL